MRNVAIIIFLFIVRLAEAQTCTGGLGDPIVNITFGHGSGPGPALAQGITNLTYQQAVCPNDGYYMITDRSSGCYGGSWLTVNQDHTGNPGGYFMLVNASYAPSDFYVQTVTGLCGGTTFQFAAWILNIASQTHYILPNITFRIEKTDGTVLQSYNTGDIPMSTTPLWIQYGFYFDTPPGISTVVIRMTNNAPGGIGNDLALDDITFRAAGPAIQASIAGYPGDTVQLCQNDPNTLSFQALVDNCYASPVYQWQQSIDSGSNWSDIAGANIVSYARPQTNPGDYLYRLSVAQAGNLGIASCKVASPPLTVSVIKTPSPSISIVPAGGFACKDSPVVFTAIPIDEGKQPFYQWLLNGNPAGSDTTVFKTSSLNSSDILSCVLTSNATCVLTPVASSNVVSLDVIPIPVTGVSMVASATNICADSLVIFTATPLNGGSSPKYQWQVNGANISTSSPVFRDSHLSDGDVVSCMMTGSLTCSPTVKASPPVTMTVHPLPAIILNPDTIIAGGKSIRLQPVITGNIANFRWIPATWLDNAETADPMAKPPGTIVYHLEVATAYGCTASAEEKVEVFYDVKLPSAFIPGEGGRNSLFRLPPNIPVTIKRLSVFNRQGQLVFSTTNTGEGWNGDYKGSPQSAGVYVWMVEYVNPLTRQSEQRKGTVMLIR